mmetsp:Transcript_9186/g.20464  ORF Transcript_9186/g.20464 Transcript_9186/m.20464 type:complete len:484 (+) Transcript_9186:62-1513(+)
MFTLSGPAPARSRCSQSRPVLSTASAAGFSDHCETPSSANNGTMVLQHRQLHGPPRASSSARRKLAAVALGMAALASITVADVHPHCMMTLGVSRYTKDTIGTSDATPREIADVVGASAAESLLMGIFVVICAFELRGVTVERGAPHRDASGIMLRGASSNALPPVLMPQPSARSEAGIEGKHLPFKRTSSQDEDGAGSVYGLDLLADTAGTGGAGRQLPTTLADFAAGLVDRGDDWAAGPLIMVMLLLHGIYPSFPPSPQVEWGRIVTLLGFLFLLGPKRCIAVVNTEPLRRITFPLWVGLCFVMHVASLIFTDTIVKLIFPGARRRVLLLLLQGQQHLGELVRYLALSDPKRPLSYPERDWVSAYVEHFMAWFVVVGVVLASAVWKEFLFRGVYLGGLRTKLPFWAANSIVAVLEALAHQPLQLEDDGTVRVSVPGCAPLFAGALCYGYLYNRCQSLQVTVLAHLMFNASIFAFTVLVEMP